MNTTSALTMRVDSVGSQTVLARIITLVRQAQGTKAPVAALADRISFYFVPSVMLIAVLAACGWYVLGGAELAFCLRIFVAVLVIACPCAMGLATPAAIMVGTGRGAQLGILIKNGAALQRGEAVQTVIFDKTGTLTYGTPELTDFSLLFPEKTKWNASALLALLAGMESESEHPLARAVVQAAVSQGLRPVAPDFSRALPGLGMQADSQGHALLVGNATLMKKHDIDGLTQAEPLAADFSKQGKTALYAAVDGRVCAVLALADTLREETPELVAQLKGMGMQLVMLTGDNEQTAQAMAAQAGIETVRAQVLPAEKAAVVQTLQKAGSCVAMVGDGINDAPALAQADLGLAMGSGIDVAVEAADMVLMQSSLYAVLTALRLSRRVMRTVRENLFWAFAFNTLGIPVAAGCLFIFGGPVLNPMLAGMAMALSSVMVVSNALRLRGFRPSGSRVAPESLVSLVSLVFLVFLVSWASLVSWVSWGRGAV